MQTLMHTIIIRNRIPAGNSAIVMRSRGVHWCLFDNKELCIH